MTNSLKYKVNDEINQALKIALDEKLKLTSYQQQNTDRRWNKPRVMIKETDDNIKVMGITLKVGTNCGIQDEMRKAN